MPGPDLTGAAPGTGSSITVVPANQVSWADLQAVFGDRGEAARCRCQWSEDLGRASPWPCSRTWPKETRVLLEA
ncbi:hypothetical protein GCM10028783_09340 [Modestobacter muralis]